MSMLEMSLCEGVKGWCFFFLFFSCNLSVAPFFLFGANSHSTVYTEIGQIKKCYVGALI